VLRLKRDGPRACLEAELVEQRHVGTRVECLAQLVERLDLDLPGTLAPGRGGSDRAAIEPAAMMWFSLTRMPS